MRHYAIPTDLESIPEGTLGHDPVASLSDVDWKEYRDNESSPDYLDAARQIAGTVIGTAIAAQGSEPIRILDEEHLGVRFFAQPPLSSNQLARAHSAIDTMMSGGKDALRYIMLPGDEINVSVGREIFEGTTKTEISGDTFFPEYQLHDPGSTQEI